jgi:hypothetical protein
MDTCNLFDFVQMPNRKKELAVRGLETNNIFSSRRWTTIDQEPTYRSFYEQSKSQLGSRYGANVVSDKALGLGKGFDRTLHLS